MNSMEGSSTNLPSPALTQSLNSLATSTVDLRSPSDRWPYEDEEPLVLEDLMAFESRLIELGSESRSCSFPWVPLVGTIFACTAISACHWIPRVRDSQSIVLRSLSGRGAFTLSLATLILTVLFGVRHIVYSKRNRAIELSRDALTLFQLKCERNGELVEISKN